MKIKKIMVVCGSAVATSVAMKQYLLEELNKRNLEVAIDTISVNEVDTKVENYDLILLLTRIKLETETPVISAIPFLTGIGLEDLINDIEKIVRS
jgi:PTS system galactitol-specific IIB component